MGYLSKLDHFRGEKQEKSTWSQYADISSSKQEVSGIKKRAQARTKANKPVARA